MSASRVRSTSVRDLRSIIQVKHVGSSDDASTKSPRQRTRHVYIGEYMLGQKLGEGATSLVHCAKHRVTKEVVAIKTVNKQAQGYDGARVHQEIDILTRLSHPNIIKLKEVFDDAKALHLVMELCIGGEVFDILDRHGLMPEDYARGLIGQVADALAYCHKHNIAHRDIKLENLLMDETFSTVKVTDFGFAVYLLKESGESNLLSAGVGTLNYASPEVIFNDGEGYEGPPVDVWSLGVCLYCMVVGCAPFDGPTVDEILEKIRGGSYAPFESLVSAECHDLIVRMFELDPKKRITMAEIATHPWMTMPKASSPSRRKRRKTVGASARGGGSASGTSPKGGATGAAAASMPIAILDSSASGGGGSVGSPVRSGGGGSGRRRSRDTSRGAVDTSMTSSLLTAVSPEQRSAPSSPTPSTPMPLPTTASLGPPVASSPDSTGGTPDSRSTTAWRLPDHLMQLHPHGTLDRVASTMQSAEISEGAEELFEERSWTMSSSSSADSRKVRKKHHHHHHHHHKAAAAGSWSSSSFVSESSSDDKRKRRHHHKHHHKTGSWSSSSWCSGEEAALRNPLMHPHHRHHSSDRAAFALSRSTNHSCSSEVSSCDDHVRAAPVRTAAQVSASSGQSGSDGRSDGRGDGRSDGGQAKPTTDDGRVLSLPRGSGLGKWSSSSVGGSMSPLVSPGFSDESLSD